MCSVIEHQGNREYMEDRYVVYNMFCKDYGLFAVFDGHGGDFVSQFCKENLPNILYEKMTQTDNVAQALFDTFSELDQKIPQDKALTTGCTAVVILKHQDHLFVANCGDSRAIINKNQEVIALTMDHKPHRIDEKERIETAGGFVTFNYGDVPRVSGNLAVSRSIGDHLLKPFVIPLPEIIKINITINNKFFVIATDGLWDIFSNDEINTMIYGFYKNPAFTDKQVLEFSTMKLNEELFKKGMHDNTTVLITHIRR